MRCQKSELERRDKAPTFDSDSSDYFSHSGFHADSWYQVQVEELQKEAQRAHPVIHREHFLSGIEKLRDISQHYYHYYHYH